MKRIDLEVIQEDQHFIVPIAVGERLRFINKTKANKFLRQYKNVISDNVGMINLMQPQINAFYRQNILSLDQISEQKIAMALAQYDERFSYIYKSFSVGNKNYFVFANIGICISHLEQAAKILYAYALRYKHYALKAGLLPILKNIELIKKQLKSDKHNLFIDYGYKPETQVRTLKKTS